MCQIKIKLLIIFAIFCSNQLLLSQKMDTVKWFKKLEKNKKNNRFNQYLFENIRKKNKTKPIIQNKFVWKKVNCKIIRHIIIQINDPFAIDSISKNNFKNRIKDLANTYHIKTKEKIINNLLLFHKNDEIDSLIINESERIIRNQRFIHEIEIKPIGSDASTDSIDIAINVVDSWSLSPSFNTSINTSNFQLSENNLLGFGHEIYVNMHKNNTKNENTFGFGYTANNIWKTFLNFKVNYQKEIDFSYEKNISLEKNFFTSYQNWSFFSLFSQQYKKIVLYNDLQIPDLQNYKLNLFECGGGYAFRVSNGNSESQRTTKIYNMFRFITKDYYFTPNFEYDKYRIFSNENTFLASIGIAQSRFIKNKNVFNFNIYENIPTGYIFNLTSGFIFKNNLSTLYLGSKWTHAAFYHFGYLSANIEIGTFFDQNQTKQSAFNASVTYFTNLFKFGNWQIRQFVKPEITLGFHRLDTNLDKLTLNGNFGISGFSNANLLGTKKIVFNFQTQMYAPWKVWGFRLNPYFNYSGGMLSNSNNSFRHSSLLSEFGIGFIISNDFLSFDTFQISFSFFPKIPGIGYNILKTNAIKSNDFQLSNYEYPKPSFAHYQ